MVDSSSMFLCFFFNDPATTEIYTLSLHDALPILRVAMGLAINEVDREGRAIEFYQLLSSFDFMRSEEHTSDSSHSSISYAVFCLKKKTKTNYHLPQQQ